MRSRGPGGRVCAGSRRRCRRGNRPGLWRRAPGLFGRPPGRSGRRYVSRWRCLLMMRLSPHQCHTAVTTAGGGRSVVDRGQRRSRWSRLTATREDRAVTEKPGCQQTWAVALSGTAGHQMTPPPPPTPADARPPPTDARPPPIDARSPTTDARPPLTDARPLPTDVLSSPLLQMALLPYVSWVKDNFRMPRRSEARFCLFGS